MGSPSRTRLVDWLVFLVPVGALLAVAWTVAGRGGFGRPPQPPPVSASPPIVEQPGPVPGPGPGEESP